MTRNGWRFSGPGQRSSRRRESAQTHRRPGEQGIQTLQQGFLWDLGNFLHVNDKHATNRGLKGQMLRYWKLASISIHCCEQVCLWFKSWLPLKSQFVPQESRVAVFFQPGRRFSVKAFVYLLALTPKCLRTTPSWKRSTVGDFENLSSTCSVLLQVRCYLLDWVMLVDWITAVLRQRVQILYPQGTAWISSYGQHFVSFMKGFLLIIPSFLSFWNFSPSSSNNYNRKRRKESIFCETKKE